MLDNFLYAEKTEENLSIAVMERAELKLDRLLNMHRLMEENYEVALREAELKCFEESGDIDDLEMCYTEAQEKAQEESKGILTRIWEAICKFARSIKEFFFGKKSKSPENEVEAPKGLVGAVVKGCRFIKSLGSNIIKWISEHKGIVATGAVAAGAIAIFLNKDKLKDHLKSKDKEKVKEKDVEEAMKECGEAAGVVADAAEKQKESSDTSDKETPKNLRSLLNGVKSAGDAMSSILAGASITGDNINSSSTNTNQNTNTNGKNGNQNNTSGNGGKNNGNSGSKNNQNTSTNSNTNNTKNQNSNNSQKNGNQNNTSGNGGKKKEVRISYHQVNPKNIRKLINRTLYADKDEATRQAYFKELVPPGVEFNAVRAADILSKKHGVIVNDKNKLKTPEEKKPQTYQAKNNEKEQHTRNGGKPKKEQATVSQTETDAGEKVNTYTYSRGRLNKRKADEIIDAHFKDEKELADDVKERLRKLSAYKQKKWKTSQKETIAKFLQHECKGTNSKIEFTEAYDDNGNLIGYIYITESGEEGFMGLDVFIESAIDHYNGDDDYEAIFEEFDELFGYDENY